MRLPPLTIFLFLTQISAWSLRTRGLNLANVLDDSDDGTSVLGTFLGDHGTVVLQNDVLKNSSSCAAMTVLFARGTGEPGLLSLSLLPPPC